jgi:hypothetical protein
LEGEGVRVKVVGKSGKKIKQSNRDREEDSKEGRVKSEIALNSGLG